MWRGILAVMFGARGCTVEAKVEAVSYAWRDYRNGRDRKMFPESLSEARPRCAN